MTATDHRRPNHPRRRDNPAPTRQAPSIDGAGGGERAAMPEGRRDRDGFWFPSTYRSPEELFTPQQRRAQARQRAIRRSSALTPPGTSV